MKLSVTENNLLIAEEVFNPFCFRTKEGLDLAVCMRDFGYEIAISKDGDKCGDVKKYRITWETITEI